MAIVRPPDTNIGATEREQRLFHAAREMAGTLTSLLPRHEMLRAVTRTATDLMGAQVSLLATIAPGGRSLTLEGFEGWCPAGSQPYQIHGLSWEVVQRGRILLDTDYPRSSYAIPELVAGGAEVLVGIPLIHRDHTVGALTVGYRDPERRLEPIEYRILHILGALSAIALQNAELHDRVTGERSRLEEILEVLPVGALLLDHDGRLNRHNAAADEIVGYPLADRLAPDQQDSLLAFRRPDGTPFRWEELPGARALRGVSTANEEVHHTTPAGREVITLVSAAPLRDRTGAVAEAIVAFQEITHRVEVERVQTEFLNIASHELRTPLTPLRLLLQQSIRNRKQAKPIELATVERMLRQSGRITQMVGDMLDVSRLERGRLVLRPVSLDLRLLVTGIVDDFRRQAPLRTITLTTPPDPVPVRADPGRIEQVVANLVDNALKYSPEDSPVEVEIGVRGDRIRTSVTDHGIGIPPDQQERLFSRFYRVRTNHQHPQQGLGLGLYISREIVERHGGAIGFETHEGRGSTFFFTLPRQE